MKHYCTDCAFERGKLVEVLQGQQCQAFFHQHTEENWEDYKPTVTEQDLFHDFNHHAKASAESAVIAANIAECIKEIRQEKENAIVTDEEVET